MSATAAALSPAPRVLRRAAWIHGPFAALLALVAVAVPAFFALRWPGLVLRPPLDVLMLPFLALMSFTSLCGAYAMWRMGAWLREQRLAATATHLVFMAPRLAGLRTCVEARVPWREVHWDGGRLLAGRHLLTLRLPVGPIFEPAALERLFEGRLPASHRVGPAALTRIAWRAGAFRVQLLIAAFALAIGLAALFAAKLIIAAPIPLSP